MKFRCDRDLLVKALSTAGRAAAAAAHSHWAGIHLSVVGDTLTAIGSDGDLLLSDTENVKGLEDGIAVVQAKIVVDVVRSLDLGMVEVDSSDEWFTVRSGRSEFRLQEVPAVSYPVPAETVGEEITLATADLADGLKQVVRAASKDDSRAVLMGVKMTTEDGSLGRRGRVTDALTRLWIDELGDQQRDPRRGVELAGFLTGARGESVDEELVGVADDVESADARGT